MKSVECLVMAVELGMAGLDAPTFKQKFDEIDTKRMLPPSIDFPWPRHVRHARNACDIRGCNLAAKCWQLLSQIEGDQQEAVLCERINTQWKAKESIYPTSVILKFHDELIDPLLDKLDVLVQEFVVAVKMGLSYQDYPDMVQRRDLLTDAVSSLQNESTLSKQLRAWPGGKRFVTVTDEHVKHMELTIERVSALKNALSVWRIYFEGTSLVTRTLEQDISLKCKVSNMQRRTSHRQCVQVNAQTSSTRFCICVHLKETHSKSKHLQDEQILESMQSVHEAYGRSRDNSLPELMPTSMTPYVRDVGESCVKVQLSVWHGVLADVVKGSATHLSAE